MMLRAALVALVAALAFGGWQYVRAERLAIAAARLDVCKEVQDLKKGAEDETDEDLADSISAGSGGLW